MLERSEVPEKHVLGEILIIKRKSNIVLATLQWCFDTTGWLSQLPRELSQTRQEGFLVHSKTCIPRGNLDNRSYLGSNKAVGGPVN